MPIELPSGRFRILCSYHFFQNADMGAVVDRLTVNGIRPEILADSGAFSAWTQGVTVTPEGYADWIHEHRDVIDCYLNLDVIDDPKASARNQMIIEDRGLAPIPVWHIRSPREALFDLLDSYRYIAVGGMVGTSWMRLMPKLVWAMKQATSAGVAVHGLGLTAATPVTRLPFYSVDSSSWITGVKYASPSMWNSAKQKMEKLDLRTTADLRRMERSLLDLGFRRRDLIGAINRSLPAAGPDWIHRAKVLALCVVSFQSLERDARLRMGPVYLADGPRPEVTFDGPGLRLFLAENTSLGMGLVSDLIHGRSTDRRSV